MDQVSRAGLEEVYNGRTLERPPDHVVLLCSPDYGELKGLLVGRTDQTSGLQPAAQSSVRLDRVGRGGRRRGEPRTRHGVETRAEFVAGSFNTVVRGTVCLSEQRSIGIRAIC